MSWKAEVVADETGNWLPNGMRFATEKEAEQYAKSLSFNWTAVRCWRVIKSDEEVNQ